MRADYVNANTFYCVVGYDDTDNDTYYYWLLKIVDSAGTLTLTWLPRTWGKWLLLARTPIAKAGANTSSTK